MQIRQEVEDLVNERFKKLPLEERLRLLDSTLGKRLGRPSGKSTAARIVGDIDLAVDEVLSIVKDNPGGVNSEFIKQQSEQPEKIVVRAIRQLLDTNLLRKTGDRRGTKYFPVLSTKRTEEVEAAPVSVRQVEMPIPPPPKGGVPGKNGVIKRKKAK